MCCKMDKKDFWDIKSFGEISEEEKTVFYDSLSEDVVEGKIRFHAGICGGDSSFFENPYLLAGIIEPDGSIYPATGYANNNRKTLKNKKIRLFLERYFAHKMPHNDFNLQIIISAKHQFDNLPEASWIANTLAVRGVEGDYVNCLSEPIFSGISIQDLLSLKISVIFISDKSTDRILGIINNENVRKGLALVGTFNPVFGMVTEYALGIGKAVLESNKNRQITKDTNITLCSSTGPLSIPLIEGTYVLIQPKKNENQLSFTGMEYNPQKGNIVVNGSSLQRNHMILRIDPL
jgi:hypothetical protein